MPEQHSPTSSIPADPTRPRNVFFRDSAAVVVAQAVGAACFGIGYGALRLRTGSVWPLMALHLLTDLLPQLGRLPKIPIFVAQDVVLLGYALFLLRGRSRAEALG